MPSASARISAAGTSNHGNPLAHDARRPSTDPRSNPAAGTVAARVSGSADAAAAVSNPNPAASSNCAHASRASSAIGNTSAAARDTTGTASAPMPSPNTVASPATRAIWIA